MRMSAAVLGPVMALIVAAVFAGSALASFGVESIQTQAQEEDEALAVQAGSHPYSVTATILFNRHPIGQPELEAGLTGGIEKDVPDGDVKSIEAVLPAGVIVNLLNVERCTEEELAQSRCPLSSQVGAFKLRSAFEVLENPFRSNNGTSVEPVYNIAPSSPKVPGELGFSVGGANFVVHLIGKVSARNGYALMAEASGINQFAALDGASVTLWGDPLSPSHDAQRGKCAQEGGLCSAAGVQRPFLTLPTRCPTASDISDPVVQGELSAWATMESWQNPGYWTTPVASPPLPVITGCDKINFMPSLEVKPETTIADSPTGLAVTLRLPQVDGIERLAEASVKEVVVTLPSGLTVSSAAAGGLEACSEAEIGFGSSTVPTCPGASKIASVEVVTPLIERPLHGSVYLAQQGNAGSAQGSNPFKSLIAMYLVIEGSGIVVKVPGKVSLNQSTGQLTASFGKNPQTGFYLPQAPFSEVKLNFFGGPRAPLVPTVCGLYTTTSVLTPWSAPQSGPPATPQSSFQVGSACSTGAFAPVLTAGTTSNQAGGFSPFVATFSRRDSEQELGAIQVHMPPGLLAMLSKVPLCGEPGAQKGECSPESQIGTVSAAVGPGADPFSVTGGRAYLTGPYRGAPFGLTFVVPAVAGPFNLGNVVVRAAISVDPITAAATVTSDPLPTILQGVPLQVRSVTVDVDRPEFFFNPTSCAKMSIAATLQGSLGARPQESVPFQAGDCAALAFKPRFSVAVSGKTSKALGASLDTRVTYPPGPQGTYANIKSVKVELPKQLPARLATLQKACVVATFEADPASCPAGSVVGVVRATTPLLSVTLSGPAYFVSYGGAKFPELIIVLQGDGVRVDLHGATFISKAGITSSTFKSIPDVPVGSFELYLPERRGSALAANGNLCKSKLVMPTVFTAQNGAEIRQRTKIVVTGCPKVRKIKQKIGAVGSAHPKARKS